MSNQETDESYYEPIVRRYPRCRNKRAIDEWFVDSEPREGKGTHTRITSVDRLETIAGMMLAQLSMDVLANSFYSWKRGTPIQDRNKKRQPLGDNGDD